MSIASSISTAEQLLAAGDIGRCELVRGELIMMSPAGAPHGRTTNRIAFLVTAHVESQKLGEVFAAETGFLISRSPDTVRAPDVAFIRRDRTKLIPRRGYFPGAPDLAIEVLSPDDSASDVMAKVDDWLNGGTEEVWIVDPNRKALALHRRDQPVQTWTESDSFDDSRVLPGFALTLSELFR